MQVSEFRAQTIELWQQSSCAFPQFERRYTKEEQVAREALLDEYTQRIEREFGANQQTKRIDNRRVLAGITAAVIELAACALDLTDPYVESLLRDGFSQVGVDFARWARELDPRISLIDILQGCRNAWVACGLQVLLGREMRLTPAIFAYSMLYPYSDNYLDDARVSREAKLRFSVRFRRRLRGEQPRTESAREEMICQLVGLIEGEYARARYPEVYESLLAIHHAQQESIAQMKANGDFDVLALTVTKGGTSVLADAYLARGTLTEVEARFAFAWGVVLQLGDDLQDLLNDRRRGSLTLFSQACRSGPLDEVTNRTFHFGQRVMEWMAGLPHGSDVLRELLARSARALLIRSAASVPELYSEGYLAELEKYSPFDFAFLRERERQFAKRSRGYARWVELLIGNMAREGKSGAAGFAIESGGVVTM